MNVFDWVIIGAAVVAAVGGYRLGFLARVLSWVGLGAGLYVAFRVLPAILDAMSGDTSTARLIVTWVTLVGIGFIGLSVGGVLGGRLHAVLPFGPVRLLDRVAGAVAGAVAVLLLFWILIPSIAQVPGWPARVTSQSAIARWESAHLPSPPNLQGVLRRVLGPYSFPQVFATIQPTQPAGPPPSTSPLSAAVTAAVAASTVKVEGQACNRILSGSGFAVAHDLVATNAHVVAGEPRGDTDVLLPSGRTLVAKVVLYDPNRDIALLQVPGLGERPLPIGPAQPGAEGAVFGHPDGQDALAVTPARIVREIDAVGPNLYHTANTSRNVYVLASDITYGDSGGALVDPAGTVVGVAFAIAPDQPGTAYALASNELEADLATPRSGHAVSTEGCIAG